ncbi:glutaminase [Nesterenkonia sp. HG001]|uniref:glutaminase n=1 Tax=Nesterenkonia sp. HG001 TaxID=2983207 RepID=UPI002AC5AA70|nr:glutaminase [Nesterenkonia sp. HG001]MDZ5077348.1 glutaminase [Nesterenkonia sp. HG001]
MHSPIPDYLLEVLESCAQDRSGELADYIPELASADADRHALALGTTDGVSYSAGDAEAQFTIQSVSKPFVYALAIDDIGLEAVRARVGVEPSGEAFNELSLEGGTGRPLNPMINAGAIATHQLVSTEGCEPLDDGAPERPARTESVRARTGRVLAGLSAFAGRELHIDYSVAESEFEESYRNRAIANMLRTHDIIGGEPTEAVRGYIDQCAVLVTVRDLALMAATLAGGGVHPVTGTQVVSAAAARQTLSVMATCGMYDGSGRWLARIGIPAKSGVSGAIIGVLPGQVGIASFAPRLDSEGNSVQGVEMFERLSQDMGLHLMSAEQPAAAAVRGITREEGPAGAATTRVALQGALRFTGAERVLREVVAVDADHGLAETVVLDLTQVQGLSSTAVRMLRELIRRLELDGHTVPLEDPGGLLEDR